MKLYFEMQQYLSLYFIHGHEELYYSSSCTLPPYNVSAVNVQSYMYIVYLLEQQLVTEKKMKEKMMLELNKTKGIMKL